MMLFVGGKDQIVQQFAARDGRVLPEHRVNEPGAVLQVRICSHDEPYGLDAVEDVTSITDNAVDELDPFAYLSAFLGAAKDRKVLQLVCPLDIGVRP